MTPRRSSLPGLLGLLAIAALAAPGCMTGDATGTVELPITATGTDGATYRLPAGTALHLTSDSGDYAADLSLDGDEPVAEMALPVGDYQAVLTNPNGYTTSWPLTRTTADGDTTVAADLLTAMPMAFSIADGQATPLTLQLRVTTVGDVTFANGTVDVSVEVGAIVGDASDASFVGHYQPITTVFDGASPALQGQLTWSNGASLPFAVDAHLAGPWIQESPTLVCADVVATGGWGEADAGWIALLSELVGGGGAVCVDGTAVSLYVRRDGDATSALAPELPGEHGFWISIQGTLPAPIYDGTTLSLSSLNESTGLAGGFLDVGIDDDASSTSVVHTWGNSNNVAIQLTP
jgi:hypothetical protein